MARIAVALLTLLALPAAAGATTIERVGDTLRVTGDDPRTALAVQVWEGGLSAMLEGHYDERVTAGPGCRSHGRSAECPREGVRSIVVRLAGTPSVMIRGEYDVPLEVLGGDEDELVTVQGKAERMRIDGGGERSNGDSVDYKFHAEPVVARLDGAPGGTHELRDIESVAGTWGADTLVGGPGRDALNGYGGADRIDVRGGGFGDHVTCGGEGSHVMLDLEDYELGCDTAEYAPAAGPVERPIPFIGRPLFESVPMVQPTGVIAGLTVADGALRFAVRARAGATVTVLGSVAPWGRPAEVAPLPSHRAVADASGRHPVELALPAAAQAASARDGRLQVRLVLRYENLGNMIAWTQAGTTTAIGPRASTLRLDGRVLVGDFGTQELRGGPGGDTIDGRSASDLLIGEGGTDRINGGSGNDQLNGGLGEDELDGDDGDDVIAGGPGDDRIVERRFGHDTLFGEDGDDVVLGGRGPDRLFGGAGDDVLAGGSGWDHFSCGDGYDIVYINFAAEDRTVARDCEDVQVEPPIVVQRCDDSGTSGPETLLGTDDGDDCYAGPGDDDVEGAGGDDRLDGGAGDDRIFGRYGADVLLGGAGDDEIEGGGDSDELHGGAGNDRLNGGFSADAVWGGAGRDRITARGGGRDVIDCGSGRDVAYVDSRDTVHRCERVVRSRRRG